MSWQNILQNWKELLLGGGLLAAAVLAGLLLHLLLSLIMGITARRVSRNDALWWNERWISTVGCDHSYS